MFASMFSPVTGSANVSVCDEIPVKKIVGQYLEEYQLDVSRFFHDLTRIHIYRCDDSGYRFYYPERIFGDAAFYEALQKRKDYYSIWTWQHDQAVKWLSQGLALLEIGCGLGEFLDRRRTSNECVGLEFNPAAVAAARAKDLAVFNETVEVHSEKFSHKYDAICAFQVFEHVHNVRSFLNGALTCLKDQGLLILSVPNNHPYVFGFDKMCTLNLPPHHAGLWSKQSLALLPRFFPLRLEQLAVEPVIYVSEHTRALQNHWRIKASPLRRLPRKLVTAYFKLTRPFLEGMDLVAVYRKIA